MLTPRRCLDTQALCGFDSRRRRPSNRSGRYKRCEACAAPAHTHLGLQDAQRPHRRQGRLIGCGFGPPARRLLCQRHGILPSRRLMRTHSEGGTLRIPGTFDRMWRRVRRRAARHGASGRRPAAKTTRLPAAPAASLQACQYAFLISVAHGFTPLMMMPAALAGVSPPRPGCRLMQL